MNFIRSIINNEEILTDKDMEELLSEEFYELDEDALARIEKRVDNREVAYYAMLVGRTNALKAKLSKDRIEEGKTVPSSLITGYQPVAELINDIVLAGPNYINLLKNLHQRAKRSR